jgi:hypothetical protein
MTLLWSWRGSGLKSVSMAPGPSILHWSPELPEGVAAHSSSSESGRCAPQQKASVCEHHGRCPHNNLRLCVAEVMRSGHRLGSHDPSVATAYRRPSAAGRAGQPAAWAASSGTDSTWLALGTPPTACPQAASFPVCGVPGYRQSRMCPRGKGTPTTRLAILAPGSSPAWKGQWVLKGGGCWVHWTPSDRQRAPWPGLCGARPQTRQWVVPERKRISHLRAANPAPRNSPARPGQATVWMHRPACWAG